MHHGDIGTSQLESPSRPDTGVQRTEIAVRVIFSIILSALLLSTALISWNQFHATRRAVLHDDSESYLAAAAGVPFSRQLWFGLRSPVYPLFIAAMGQDVQRVTVGQWVVGVVSWSLLALGVYRVARTYLAGVLGAALVLAFSLSPDIVSMYRVILSESLSFSFLAGMCGAALLYLRGLKWPWLIPVCVYAWLYALVREANAVVVLCGALVALAAALYFIRQALLTRRDAVPIFCATGAMIVAFVLAFVSASGGQRWIKPFYNVLSTRILPYPSRVQWFEKRGMPVSDALMQRAGKWFSSDDYAYFHDPRLAAFREWTAKAGKRTYARWLLTHPVYLIVEPLTNRQVLRMLAHCNIESYGASDFRPLHLLPNDIEPANYLLWVFAAGCLLSVAPRQMGAGTGGWMLFPIALLALSLPHFLVVYHGDAMQVERHCVQVSVQIKLAVVIGGAFSLELFGHAIGMMMADPRVNAVFRDWCARTARGLSKPE